VYNQKLRQYVFPEKSSMINMKSILGGLCILLFAHTITAQGPLDGYLKGKGVLDIAPSFSFMNARDFAGANDQLYNERFQGSLLSVFAEYGVTNNFDVVVNIPYVFTNGQSGLQDGGFYVKYRPIYADLKGKGRLGVMGGFGTSFPMSNYEVTIAGALGQRAVTVPARMIVQWDTPLGLFFNLTGGYNWRLDNLRETDIATIRAIRPGYNPLEPRDFSTALFRVGFPAKHYYLDAWIERQWTNGGADYVPNVPDLPQAYGVTYTQMGGTIYYSSNGRTGFLVSGAYIPSGRNVSRIARFTLGMVYKIKKV
jgi:hypothetical protein